MAIHLPATSRRHKRFVIGSLLAAALTAGVAVLWPFVMPVLWAIILVHVTWPLHQRLRRKVSHDALSALLMTLLLTATLLLPIVSLGVILRAEVSSAYTTVTQRAAAGTLELPQSIQRIPGVGPRVQRTVERYARDPQLLASRLDEWIKYWADELRAIVGNVGRAAFTLGLTLLVSFFLFRDGERILRQIRLVLRRYADDKIEPYSRTVSIMINAVVFGVVLTGIVQGTLAGLGYWAAGVHAPIFLATLTALTTLLPFVGTPLVWMPVSLWLFLTEQTVAAAGLMLWGALVVGTVDNVLRPLMISGATHLPFLLILFGVLGGVFAFGLIGLFLGPIILGILMESWRQLVSKLSSPVLYDGTSAARTGRTQR